MRSKMLLILSVLFVAVISGCALNTETIGINYNSQTTAQIIPSVKKTSRLAVSVSDSRLDRINVSRKKNGYGMEMAGIESKDDVSLVLRKAIEYELLARGFSIGENAEVLINTDIQKFYNDFKNGFFSGDAVADLHMSVVVKTKGSKVIYTRNITARGIEASIQLASGDNAQKALEKALSDGLKKLFDDQDFINALTLS